MLASGAFKSGPAMPSKVDWVRPKGLVFWQMQSSAMTASEQVKVAWTGFRKMAHDYDNPVIVRYRPQTLIERPMGVFA